MLPRAIRLYRRIRTQFLLRRAGVSFGSRPMFGTSTVPQITNLGRCTIGDSFIVDCFFRPVVLYCGPGATLEIGHHVYLNSGCHLHAAGRIVIGDHTRIAPEAYLCDTNFHEIDEHTPSVPAPIVLGRNVWVGRRATILPGVTIGDHSIIAAGAIVTRDVPARSIAAGSPARVVKTLQCRDDWVRR